MELNTSTLSDFVKLANVIWQDSYSAVPTVMRNSGLFKVTSIPKGTGDKREFSEIDLERFAKNKDEGDQASRGKIQQGYTVTMSAVRRGLDIGITKEMRDRNKYETVVSNLINLGQQVPERMELDLAHRITFGTATTYTDMDGATVSIAVGDGFQLFYTDHTLRGTSTTYRNRLASNPKVSKGALEGMERLVKEETLNQFGQKMSASFGVIWTTDDPNACNTVKEYLRATSDPTNVNNGIPNVYSSKYRHIELPMVATDANGLTDTTKRYYWGLASTDPRVNSAHLGIWEEAHMLTPDELGKDSTEDWDFGTRGSYGIVILNGGWIKFSSGDGAA
jgi:hypothetical protein